MIKKSSLEVENIREMDLRAMQLHYQFNLNIVYKVS